MIDVRKLRLLSALQRLGTISAVAEEMHLSAPGVSMQLSALEKELGLRLTERHGRRLALTAAGSALATHGNDILDRLSLAELEIESLRNGDIGRYTLAAFPSAVRTFVADALRRILSDDGPTIDLRLLTTEPEGAIRALSAGEADLAVVHSYSNVPREVPSGLTLSALGSEPVWLATHATSRTPARLSDYADSSWIAPDSDVTCFTMMERACGLAGFHPRIVATSMDFTAQLELVAAGVGVALVPSLTVASVPAGVELRELEQPVRRYLHLAARAPQFADPGVRNLVDILTQTAILRLREGAILPKGTSS